MSGKKGTGQQAGNCRDKYEAWLNKYNIFQSAASQLIMNQFHVQDRDCGASELAHIIYCGF